MCKIAATPLGNLLSEPPSYGANVPAVPAADGWPRYIRITDIFESGELGHYDIKGIDPRIAGPYLLEEGDILIARSGNTVGKSYIHRDTNLSAAHAGYLIKFRFDRKKACPIFIYHYLHSGEYWSWVQSASKVAAQPNINAKQYCQLPIPRISTLQQCAIATILDTVDEAIRRTEALIAKLRQVKAGMLRDLLTCGLDENGELRDPIRHPEQFKNSPLGRIPKGWNLQKFENVCVKIQDGTHFSPASTSGPCMYITSKNIRFGYMVLTDVGWISKKEHEAIYKRCDVRLGDVFLTKDGANTGNAAINNIEKPFSLLSSVALLRCDEIKIHNLFLLQMLLSQVFQKNIQESMSGNAITRLTLEKINNFQLALPSYEEQLLISKCLNSLQEKVDNEETVCEKLKTVKQGLMHDLLTGRVRVPESMLHKYKTEVDAG